MYIVRRIVPLALLLLLLRSSGTPENDLAAELRSNSNSSNTYHDSNRNSRKKNENIIIIMITKIWLRTNGVKTNRAAAKVIICLADWGKRYALALLGRQK